MVEMIDDWSLLFYFDKLAGHKQHSGHGRRAFCSKRLFGFKQACKRSEDLFCSIDV